MFSCGSMRVAVLLSATLLGLGVVLGAIAMTTALMIPTSQLALLLVLTGAAVLVVVFVDAMLPGADRRLDGCRH
jgi:zinc transporter ZupT